MGRSGGGGGEDLGMVVDDWGMIGEDQGGFGWMGFD